VSRLSSASLPQVAGSALGPAHHFDEYDPFKGEAWEPGEEEQRREVVHIVRALDHAFEHFRNNRFADVRVSVGRTAGREVSVFARSNAFSGERPYKFHVGVKPAIPLAQERHDAVLRAIEAHLSQIGIVDYWLGRDAINPCANFDGPDDDKRRAQQEGP
jgi:hypothetical protein